MLDLEMSDGLDLTQYTRMIFLISSKLDVCSMVALGVAITFMFARSTEINWLHLLCSA